MDGLVRKRSIDKTDMSERRFSRELAWADSASLAKGDRARPRSESSCSSAGCFVGPVLILLGVILMWWADLNTLQKAQASAVGKEIDSWEELYKNTWQGSHWELLVNGTEIGQLVPSPKTAVLEETSSLSVTSNQRTRMNVIGSVFPFPRNSTVQEGAKGQPVTDLMQQQVKIEVQASRPGSGQQMVQLYKGPLVWSAAQTVGSWKVCHHAHQGFWDSRYRKCISWHYLANLCLELELEPVSGQWRPSMRYGDVGCNVYQKFDPVVSEKLQVKNWRVDTLPNITMEQGYKSTVTIYEVHDPFMFAANLTQGGMVLAEDRVNEVALGITSALFGLVLMLPFILLKIIAVFEPQVNKADRPFDAIPFYACAVDDH